MHVLIHERLIDEIYIRDRTEGFEAVRAHAATFWPERVERMTGVPQRDLVAAARALGLARNALVLTARGAEQQSQGVANVLCFINLALAMGRVGRPFNGYGCLTGQGNGQGGREHGQKADQLPGYRRIDDAAARDHIAQLWGIDAEDLPGPGRSAYQLLDSLGRDRGVRRLVRDGLQPRRSPRRTQRTSNERLGALDLLVVCDFFLSETARLADVVLPSAQWAEEDGTMTNLEGRVIRRRAVVAPPEGVRTDLEILSGLARALGRPKGFPASSARRAQRTARGDRGRAGRLLRHHARRASTARAACSGRAHRPMRLARRGCSRIASTRRSGKARFHRVQPMGPAERPDAEYPLLPDDRPHPARTTSPARRRAASRSCARRRAKPSPRCIRWRPGARA